MSKVCRICANPGWPEKVQAWVNEGVADRVIARSLSIGKSLVTRHRVNHIIKPLEHTLAIAGRGASAHRQRQEIAAAATSDAPTPAQFVEAFFGLKAQAEKLQRIEHRLERVAVLAEESASPNAVAQVAAQQLRSVEVGAKVAGVGGYAPARAADQAAGAQTFSVNIIFASTGETVSINPVTGTVPASMVDGELEDE
jgi:hypothetical protein